MKYSLILLPFLATAAYAQEDIWKSLKIGDRVQITFRSGNMISGQLAPKPGDPRITVTSIDYTHLDVITLNVSLEYPGLNGTLSIAKKEIKEIRKLQALDPTTMKKIQEELDRIKAQSAVDEAARKAAEEERDAAAKAARAAKEKQDRAEKDAASKGQNLVKEAEEIEKGLALLAKFPPDAGWGPAKLKEIGEKTQRKQPATPEELEFTQVYDQWSKALQYKKSQDKETPKEEPKKEEATPEKKQ